jgi:hypothetical protein
VCKIFCLNSQFPDGNSGLGGHQNDQGFPDSGAIFCGAPGRRSQSIERAQGTRVERPAFASRQKIIRHKAIFILLMVPSNGMGVY